MEMELTDMIYHHKGEEAMRLSENVPKHVIEAYLQLSQLKRQQGEAYPQFL